MLTLQSTGRLSIVAVSSREVTPHHHAVISTMACQPQAASDSKNSKKSQH